MPRRRGKQDPFEGFRDAEPIGQGAFAQVYRATDEYTGQPVALKVLDVEASKRLDTAAFDLEARALGTVNDHPNIVTLYRAIVRPHGAPMLVMELCQGSLADELYQNGPLPVQQVIAIGVKLCGALETAHRAGILHRDLKPQNLLITRYGEPALADFGVAALRDAAAGSSSPLSGLTLLHAAPEVILGHQASPASDVYGLVSTLYELLGGHAPHFITADEDPAVVQRRVLNDPPPALQAPGVTRRLADLVTQALGKIPDGRPPTAKDLAQQLRLVERESGWPLTSCRIAGEGDLPIPDAPPPPPASSPSRAARMTGLPDLGLGARPLGRSSRSTADRDLDPLGPRETVLLPSRGTSTTPVAASAPATGADTPGSDGNEPAGCNDGAEVARETAAAERASRADTAEPVSGGDVAGPATRAGAAEPADRPAATDPDQPRIMRAPSGLLPGFGADTSGPDDEAASGPDDKAASGPDDEAASADDASSQTQQPESGPSPSPPRAPASSPSAPAQEHAPPAQAPSRAPVAPTPLTATDTPPTPPQATETPSAAPVPSPLTPAEPEVDPTAPLWGFEQRRGLHETVGLASSGRRSSGSREAEPDDDRPRRRKGRRRRRKAD